MRAVFEGDAVYQQTNTGMLGSGGVVDSASRNSSKAKVTSTAPGVFWPQRHWHWWGKFNGLQGGFDPAGMWPSKSWLSTPPTST